jgi:uncharacterized protein
VEIYTLPITGADGAGKFIIYRPVSGLAFVGNQATANICLGLAGKESLPESGVQKDLLDFLHAVGFFEEDLPPAEPPADFQPNNAALLLTNQCQLRCTYCYAAAGEFPAEEMPLEVGFAAIDYVHDVAQSKGWSSYELAFHGGGEPTAAWRVIQTCTEYARKKPLPAKITLTSNGMWTSPQADWILANLNGVSISMDGGYETQDRQRPTAGGQRSSERVMRTIALLDQHNFPYGIRMTALAPWDALPGDVRFICENTQCKSMQAEPAFNAGRGRHGCPGDQDAGAFVAAFMQAFEIAAQAGRNLRYSGSRLGMVTPTFCNAPYNALVAGPNGQLVACYEIASDTHALAQLSTIGQITDAQVTVDLAARSNLHALIAERRAGCRDCFCYWSCAGDCYTRNFDAETNTWQHGVRCEINKLLMEKMLLRAIAEGGGVWRSAQRMSAPLSIGDFAAG